MAVQSACKQSAGKELNFHTRVPTKPKIWLNHAGFRREKQSKRTLGKGRQSRSCCRTRINQEARAATGTILLNKLTQPKSDLLLSRRSKQGPPTEKASSGRSDPRLLPVRWIVWRGGVLGGGALVLVVVECSLLLFFKWCRPALRAPMGGPGRGQQKKRRPRRTSEPYMPLLHSKSRGRVPI